MHEEPGATAGSGTPGSGASGQAQKPLDTVSYDPTKHQGDQFQCAKSQRCAGFFAKDWARLHKANYTRTFIFPDPTNAAQIWGYYTLSPASIEFEQVSKSRQKTIPGHIGIPLVRIGFLARDDRAPKDLGAALLVDAARRVFYNESISAWGFILEPEGGPGNQKLWEWYEKKIGFTPVMSLDPAKPPVSMYIPLKTLIPEEWAARR